MVIAAVALILAGTQKVECACYRVSSVVIWHDLELSIPKGFDGLGSLHQCERPCVAVGQHRNLDTVAATFAEIASSDRRRGHCSPESSPRWPRSSPWPPGPRCSPRTPLTDWRFFISSRTWVPPELIVILKVKLLDAPAVSHVTTPLTVPDDEIVGVVSVKAVYPDLGRSPRR